MARCQECGIWVNTPNDIPQCIYCIEDMNNENKDENEDGIDEINEIYNINDIDDINNNVKKLKKVKEGNSFIENKINQIKLKNKQQEDKMIKLTAKISVKLIYIQIQICLRFIFILFNTLAHKII